MAKKTIRIGKRLIGEGQPVYVIAEMSANHNQRYERAEAIVRAAKKAGADAVKLQTYTADTITLDCRNDYFLIKGTIWKGQNLHDLYKQACTPWEWQPRLKKLADSLGLDLFSAPFDETAVDFLEKMNVPVYKVASCELNHIPLLRKIAKTGKPMILSTGTATVGEIEEAIATIRAAGCRQYALLKCTAEYPAPPQKMHLRTIPDMARRFDCPVGLSDHTMGVAVPGAAVALGACIIEKHLTLSRADGGPDGSFSLEPAELKALVDSVRIVEKAVGGVDYPGKHSPAHAFRRSLFIAEDVRAGEAFTAKNVRCVRPGDGMHPRYFDRVLSLRAAKNVKKGTPLSAKLIKGWPKSSAAA